MNKEQVESNCQAFLEASIPKEYSFKYVVFCNQKLIPQKFETATDAEEFAMKNLGSESGYIISIVMK